MLVIFGGLAKFSDGITNSSNKLRDFFASKKNNDDNGNDDDLSSAEIFKHLRFTSFFRFSSVNGR